MAKTLNDILKGVKASRIVPGSTGKDPGVDYAPKAKAEQDFVAKHKTEKHADRVGNNDDVYQGKTEYVLNKATEKRHGYKEEKVVKELKSPHYPVVKLLVKWMMFYISRKNFMVH